MIFSKISGLNNSVYGNCAYPIRKWMEEREEYWQARSKIEQIFGMDKIDTWAAMYGGMTSLGDLEPVAEGGAYPALSMQEGYSKTIEPYEFKGFFELTQQMEEDGKLLKEGKRGGGGLVRSYYRTREKFAVSLFNNITSTTFTFGAKTFDNKCQDGGAIAATSHTSKTTGAAIANSDNYDTVAFSYTNLLKAERKMQKFPDDDGNKLGIQPNLIVIPNEAEMVDLVMDTVRTKSGRPGTTDHSNNIHEDRWDVIVWDVLDIGLGGASCPWFLLDSDYAQEFGLQFVDRIPLTIKQYVDENTDNLRTKARARFGVGCPDWRCIYASIPA